AATTRLTRPSSMTCCQPCGGGWVKRPSPACSSTTPRARSACAPRAQPRHEVHMLHRMIPTGPIRAAGMLSLAALVASCGGASSSDRAAGRQDAASFVAEANERLLELGNKLARAQWVASNFITIDTEQLSADATRDYVAASMAYAKQAATYDADAEPPDVARQLMLLKLSASPLPAPERPEAQAELTRLVASME